MVAAALLALCPAAALPDGCDEILHGATAAHWTAATDLCTIASCIACAFLVAAAAWRRPRRAGGSPGMLQGAARGRGAARRRRTTQPARRGRRGSYTAASFVITILMLASCAIRAIRSEMSVGHNGASRDAGDKCRGGNVASDMRDRWLSVQPVDSGADSNGAEPAWHARGHGEGGTALQSVPAPRCGSRGRGWGTRRRVRLPDRAVGASIGIAARPSGRSARLHRWRGPCCVPAWPIGVARGASGGAWTARVHCGGTEGIAQQFVPFPRCGRGGRGWGDRKRLRLPDKAACSVAPVDQFAVVFVGPSRWVRGSCRVGAARQLTLASLCGCGGRGWENKKRVRIPTLAACVAVDFVDQCAADVMPIIGKRATGSAFDAWPRGYDPARSPGGCPAYVDLASVALALITRNGLPKAIDAPASPAQAAKVRVVFAAYVIANARTARRRRSSTAELAGAYVMALVVQGIWHYDMREAQGIWDRVCEDEAYGDLAPDVQGTLLVHYDCRAPLRSRRRGHRASHLDGAVLMDPHSTPTPHCSPRSGYGQISRDHAHYKKEDLDRDGNDRVGDEEYDDRDQHDDDGGHDDDEGQDQDNQEAQDQRTFLFGHEHHPLSSSPSSPPHRTSSDGDPTQEGGVDIAARPQKNATESPLPRREEHARSTNVKAVSKRRGFFANCGPTHGDITIDGGHAHGEGVGADGDDSGNDFDGDRGVAGERGCSDDEDMMRRRAPPPPPHPRPSGYEIGHGHTHAGGAARVQDGDESSGRRQRARTSIVKASVKRGRTAITADNNHDANGGWDGGCSDGGRPRPRPHGPWHTPPPPRTRLPPHTRRCNCGSSTLHGSCKQFDFRRDSSLKPVFGIDESPELSGTSDVLSSFSTGDLCRGQGELFRTDQHSKSRHRKSEPSGNSLALGRGRVTDRLAAIGWRKWRSSRTAAGRRLVLGGGGRRHITQENISIDAAPEDYDKTAAIVIVGALDSAGNEADGLLSFAHGGHDSDGDGGGVHDDAGSMVGGVCYSGEASLLDLRGGGVVETPAADNGAGVLGWLDADSDTDEQAYQREQLRRIELELIDDDLRELSAAQSHHQRRPQPVITGRQGETPVIVCGGCMRDVPILNLVWRQCGCNAFRCGACAQRPCTTCGLLALQRGSSIQDAEEGLGDTAGHIDNRTVAAPEVWDYQAASWFAWDCAADDAVAGSAPSALTCASCTVGSRSRQGHWSLCQCGFTYCAECAAWGCPACGGLRAHLPRSADVPSGEIGNANDARDQAQEGASSDGETWDMPPILSPQQALARREAVLDKHRRQLGEKRRHSHVQEKRQAREGRRPRRQRDTGQSVTFATVNVTSPQRLKEELTRQGELADCDFVAAQEVGLHGELAGLASDWLQRHHWTGVIDPPYRKHAGYGGGTAVVSRHPTGIRRACHGAKLLRGRLTTGITQVSFSITVASFYGVSGASLPAQVPYWRELADILISLARPFVVCGDWQRPPP